MRQRLPNDIRVARQGRTWLPSAAAVDFIALGAAVAVIAAIALGTPHLH